MHNNKSEGEENNLDFKKHKFNDYLTLFNSNKFKNVTLIFGKSIKIRCHKAILTQSPFLKEEIKSILLEKEEENLVQEDIENKIPISDDMGYRVGDVKFIIQWFYGKKPETENVEAENLIKMAKKFKLHHLLEYINKVIINKEENLDNIIDSKTNLYNHIKYNLYQETKRKIKKSGYINGLDNGSTNFIFIAGNGKEIAVHKEVLTVHSDFFQKTITDLSTKNKNAIRLHQNETVVRLLISYLYTQEIDSALNFSFDDLAKALKFAEEINLVPFEELIVSKIKEFVTNDNCVELLQSFYALIKDCEEIEQHFYKLFCTLFDESIAERFFSYTKKPQNYEKSLSEEADEYIYFATQKLKSENIINRITEKNKELVKKKANLFNVYNTVQKKITEDQEKNAKIQFSIAKSVNAKKINQKISTLEKQLENAEDKTSLEKEIEKMKNEQKEILEKNEKDMKELKQNEKNLLEHFEEKKKINGELEEIDHKSAIYTRDITEINSIKM